MSRRVLVLLSVLALLAATMSTASANPWEVTDIFDQGDQRRSLRRGWGEDTTRCRWVDRFGNDGDARTPRL